METVNWILLYIYSIAHLLGTIFLKGINVIFQFSTFPTQLIDPIGFLIILTLFFIIVVAARKLAKWILIVSWILIFFKIILTIYEK